MGRKGQVAIYFLSVLSGAPKLSAAFQTSHTLCRTNGLNPVPSPVKSYDCASFGLPTRGGGGVVTTSPTRLQNSYLDSLSDASSSSTTASVVASGGGDSVIDFGSISKYTIAAVTQLGLFSLSFLALDTILARTTASVLPSPVTWLIFYAMSLKSRVFNPLNNRRPDAKQAASGKGSPGFKDRIMPRWTPPGVTFPVLWILLIPSLRATSSTIVVNALGRYCDATVMSLVLHLTCGDVWNTINNTERRYGTSVLANVFTYLAAVYASLSYGAVRPLAGKLLGLTCVWLTIASCLITQTWRLNVGEDGRKDSLLPRKKRGGDSPTKFWFQ